MGESLSKIVSIIIAVLLLFIFPIMNMFEKQDDISRNIVFNETTKFVDSVRNLGYITPKMYNDFIIKIEASGNVYEVAMTHMHLVVYPVYTDVTDLSSFQGKASENYENFYNHEILNQLFPEVITGDELYRFSCGDYFLVETVNKNKTMGTKIREFILNADLPDRNIIVNYGGMIRNESN